MADKTQVMAEIEEKMKYPSGEYARGKSKYHKFVFNIPDKYAKSNIDVQNISLKMIQNKLGTGHDLVVSLQFWDKKFSRERQIDFKYVSKNPKFLMPQDYTELRKYSNRPPKAPSDKPKVSAGERFDSAMKKSMEGAKKAGNAINKGMDWFFMQGEFAKKKTPAKKTTKKTTGKKKTTTRKRTYTTRSRQYAPSMAGYMDDYDMMYGGGYPMYETYDDYDMMPMSRSYRRY